MSALIDELGRVNPSLIQLARRAGLEVSDTVSPDAMNIILQKNWIQRGKFRYEIEGLPPGPEDLALLTEIGCIEEVKAPTSICNFYDGALFLGALLTRVRMRLAYLVQEYRRGAHFKTMFLLGSERQLNAEKESATDLQFPKEGLPLRANWQEDIVSLPTTEIEMMKYVFEQSVIPEEWEVVVVHTPNVPLVGSGSRPANTGDTFMRWQEQTQFVEGRFLVVSNNPFVAYQETNARRILPPEMELFGIGASANIELPLGTFLDNLAKQFYEETKLRQRFTNE